MLVGLDSDEVIFEVDVAHEESEHFVAPATSEQVGGDQLMMLAQPSGSIEVSGSLIDL